MRLFYQSNGLIALICLMSEGKQILKVSLTVPYISTLTHISQYVHNCATGYDCFRLTQLYFNTLFFYHFIQIIRYMFRSYDHLQTEI
jgi:hypothetical protein